MIQPVNALTPKVSVKGREYGNPVSRKTERRLAIMNAGGLSVVAGAVVTAVGRSFTSSWKSAGLIGVGAGVLSMGFLCPHLLYKSDIKSYAKEKEMEVFTKEKEIQKKLLTDVNDAIDEHDPELHDKIENYSKTINNKEN